MIVNDRKWDILKLFYENKTEEFHLREIARQKNLNENSAYRFLKQLEDEKILISRKDSNLKKYRINNSLYTFSLFTVFDTKRFENIESIISNNNNLIIK